MDTTPSVQDSLTIFLTDIIIDKHGATIDEQTKNELINELRPRLNRWVTLQAMTEIAKTSASDLKTLQDMTTNNTPQQDIEQFILSKIPDQPAFLTKTLLAFRQAYIG